MWVLISVGVLTIMAGGVKVKSNSTSMATKISQLSVALVPKIISVVLTGSRLKVNTRNLPPLIQACHR